MKFKLNVIFVTRCGARDLGCSKECSKEHREQKEQRAGTPQTRCGATEEQKEHPSPLPPKEPRGTEVVSSCADALLTILWEAHQRGVERLSTKELSDEAFRRFRRSHKTVENTLAQITGSGKEKGAKPLCRPQRGFYALTGLEVQRRLSLYRDPSKSGGVNSKSIAAQGVWQPPDQTPDGEIGGNEMESKPPATPRGDSSGGGKNPVVDRDLAQTPPDSDGLSREAVGTDSSLVGNLPGGSIRPGHYEPQKPQIPQKPVIAMDLGSESKPQKPQKPQKPFISAPSSDGRTLPSEVSEIEPQKPNPLQRNASEPSEVSEAMWIGGVMAGASRHREATTEGSAM